MASTADLIATVEQLRLDAVTLVAAADYAAAYIKLLAIKTFIDTGVISQEKDGHRFDFRDFETLMVRVERERDLTADHRVLRMIRVNSKRPSGCECD